MGQRSRRRERATGAEEARGPARRGRAVGPPSGRDAMAERYARGRAKDAEARAQLEPLREGERPVVLTVAAVAAGVIAAANIAAALLSNSDHNQLPLAVVQAAVIGAAGVGMWRVKYWAILGFEALLAIQMLVLFLFLLAVRHLPAALLLVAAILALGYLFYKLIRVMARVQMPQRRASGPPA